MVKRPEAISAVAGEAGPRRPPLVFRVGAVGHRPRRLRQADPERLRTVMRGLLGKVKRAVVQVADEEAGLYADGPAELRALTPLAEGSDRFFANAALEEGYRLCCPLPFAQAEYEKDFGQSGEFGSRQEFHDLLKRAHEGGGSVFELDGQRDDGATAYGAAGRVVLNQSDLLVVVWDGLREDRRGGTEESLDDALRAGVPIVLIQAQAPHEWRLVLSPTDLHSPPAEAPAEQDNRLRQAVRGILLPSAGADEAQDAVRHGLSRFYAERRPRWDLGLVWKPFRDLLGAGKLSAGCLRVEDFDCAVLAEWPCDESTAAAKIVNWLRPFYAWPDKLSVIYSSLYRSAFLLGYALAALAVAMALAPVAAQWFGHPPERWRLAPVAMELAMIVAALALIFEGRRRKWHERWIDYRLAAELIRHLRLVAPLGGSRPLPRTPGHWRTYGHPDSIWVGWYVRAVRRGLELPDVAVDAGYVRACLNDLRRVLSSQGVFHTSTAGRCRSIERRLHRLGVWLFGLTVVACAVHLAMGLMESPSMAWLTWTLVATCGILPAMGAAAAGISNQGEFARIAKRSQAMSEQLRVLALQADSLEKKTPEAAASSVVALADVLRLAEQAAQLMVAEVLDWRVVLLDQPLRTM